MIKKLDRFMSMNKKIINISVIHPTVKAMGLLAVPISRFF